MPKAAAASARTALRHNPLHEELANDAAAGVRKVARAKRRERKERDDGYYELTPAAKRMAAEQQDEVEAEEAAAAAARVPPRGAFDARFAADDDDDDDEDEDEDADADGAVYEEWQDEDGAADEAVDEIEVDAEDAALFDRFAGRGGEQRQSLADIILAKIAESEARAGAAGGGVRPGGTGMEDGDEMPQLPPKVIEVYTKVGILLSRYKSGKLPKAFKIVPSLNNWEEILYITRPDKWTPHATYEATRLFSAQQSSRAQRFLNLILLDRVKDDIEENKKLNIHLYNAIKKSLYKPAAFFKGFLFPLVSSSCNLQEAKIIGSVLTRVSIPVLHSAAALLRLCEMEYSPATAVFIKILIDKKYALPYKVVDALVFYFMKYRTETQPMPLLWHQGFLAFAQRYKNDITEDQRDMLLDVLLVKGHEKIAPEIRRELLEGRGRGNELEAMGAADDDVMME